MYAGKLIEKGNVDDLLGNPKHPYTLALLAATPEPDYQNALTFKEIPAGEPPSLVNPPAGCRFHPRCPYIIKRLCDVEVPPDFQIEPGHTAACWLHKDAGTQS